MLRMVSSDLNQEPMDGFGEMIRKVAEGQETAFNLVTDLDGGRKLVVERRKLMPELPQQLPVPDVARAKARSHVFYDVGAFGLYLNRCGTIDQTLILADVAKQTIVAVLDESAETDRETVSLKTVQHPLFTPWANLLNKAIKVVEFSLFIMQNRRAVLVPDGRELAMVFQQIKMSKAVTVQTGIGKKALNGVMVDMEIAGEKRGSLVELPDSIEILVPLFVGTKPQRVIIDLLVTANSTDEVVVYCTASDVEAAKIIAFEEMIDDIRNDTSMLIGFGEVSHREWDTVPLQKQ